MSVTQNDLTNALAAMAIWHRNYALESNSDPILGNNNVRRASKRFFEGLKVGDFVTFGAFIENVTSPTATTVYLQKTSLGDEAMSQVAYTTAQGLLYKTFQLTQADVTYLSDVNNVLSLIAYSSTGQIKVSQQFLFKSQNLHTWSPAPEDYCYKHRNYVLESNSDPILGNNHVHRVSKRFFEGLKVGDFVTFGSFVENIASPTATTVYLQKTSLGDEPMSQTYYTTAQGLMYKTFQLTQDDISYLSDANNVLSLITYSVTGQIKVSQPFLFKSQSLHTWSPTPEDFAMKADIPQNVFLPKFLEVGTDLNSIRTPGLYCCQSSELVSQMEHIPIAEAFSLFVEMHAGVKQTFTTSSVVDPQIWFRNYSEENKNWGRWTKVATINDIPRKPLSADRIFVTEYEPSNPREGDIWFKR